MDDGETLFETYDAWREAAGNVAARLAAGGSVIRRVEIDPDAFLAYCARHGLERNGAARSSRFAQAFATDPPESGH